MKRKLSVLVPAVALLAGCGGALHGVTPQKTAAGPSSGGTAAAQVRILIPAPPTTLSNERRAQFVSPSTNGVLVDVYAASDTTHANVLASSATDVSSGSVACGGTTGTPRTCTVPIPAPSGDDDFAFTTYDQAPVSGSFTGAKQLGVGSVTQTIAASQANTVAVTLGGVVASVHVALTTAAIHGTAASSQVLAVTALDADGNTIVSDGYMDASGNPVTIALAQTIANKSGGGGNGTTSATGANSGTVTLATASLTQPSTSGVALSYDGAAKLPSCGASPCDGTFVDTITATPSNGATAASATLTTLGPKIVEYATPTANSSPYGIAAGPDGNLWFTEQPANQIGKITPSGTITEYAIPTANSYPYGIAAGPDGNLWFTEGNVDKIGKIAPSGTITEYATTAGSFPTGIAAGPDGNVWFTEQSANNIGKITPSGTVTEYAIPTGNSQPDGIAAGPDGNVWFTEGNANKIGMITPSGTITEYAIPTAFSYPTGIAAGPDGNLWFTEQSGNNIGKITPGGVITEYATPTTNSNPFGIAAGPDGNMWFAEDNANNIGKITPGGVITEYATPTANSQPFGIAAGPDGNVWFTEYNANNIGVFSW